MKIAVIVLHYQNLSDTLECLHSLSHQNYSDYEILLVDNGSQDPTFTLQEIPRLTLIKNSTNLGFAEGNNTAIRAALERKADAVLLLNNDTTVAPDLLTQFAQAAKIHPNAGSFGAKIYFYDEPTVIWHAGGGVNPTSFRCYHLGCGESDLEKKYEEICPIEYACGCALFVPRATIEKVGLMAPEFFLLWEEIDWCFRMAHADRPCFFIPQAKVWHKISRSFEGGNRGPLWQYYYFRNRLLFLRRHLSFFKRLQFYFTRFSRELFQILYHSFAPHTSLPQKQQNRAALRGIMHHFILRYGEERK